MHPDVGEGPSRVGKTSDHSSEWRDEHGGWPVERPAIRHQDGIGWSAGETAAAGDRGGCNPCTTRRAAGCESNRRARPARDAAMHHESPSPSSEMVSTIADSLTTKRSGEREPRRRRRGTRRDGAENDKKATAVARRYGCG